MPDATAVALPSIRARALAARGDIAATTAISRLIETDDWQGLHDVPLFWLSSFTSEPLHPYLVQEGAAADLRLRPSFGPYGQLEQLILDPDSPAYYSASGVVVIATRLEDVSGDLVSRFLTFTGEEIESRSDRIVGRMLDLIRTFRAGSNVPVLVWNWAPPLIMSSGLADPCLNPSISGMVSRMNDRLAVGVREVVDSYVFDYANAVREAGLEHLLDRRMELRARLPFSAAGMATLARRTARVINALHRSRRKCLVVDLDNTLWGGVIGEDGLGGIALGEDHPGRAFKSLHAYLLALRDCGVLLAIASKNNPDDALQVLRSHPDSLLRPEHFAAIEIGWSDKATSLRRIADSLSIGTDALAFLDDSHFERDWIRDQLPEVAVIDMPDEPDRVIQAIDSSGFFDQLVILGEDRTRAGMYGQQALRRDIEASATSVDQFLEQLHLKASVGQVGSDTIDRVIQLLGKTNQFNVTTRRHSAGQLRAMIANGAIAVWLRVADRFGDLGLVGVGIAVPGESSTWRVDSFLLSCRVIGRQAEKVLMEYLVRMVREQGARQLVGEFIPTAKNAPAANLFRETGFSQTGDPAMPWVYDVTDSQLATSPLYTVIEEHNADA